MPSVFVFLPFWRRSRHQGTPFLLEEILSELPEERFGFVDVVVSLLMMLLLL